ncbi:MAG: CBS domain-containing protein [Pseudomonadota bacterium]
MRVRDILGAKGAGVTTVEPAATVAEAANVLAERNFGAVVVADAAGGLAGIVSERDIVRRLANDGADVLGRAVADIMTANIHTCGLDDTLDDLLGRMTERRIRHLPAVGENGALVGMISIGDVVKRKIDLAAREAEDLKAYIAAG